MPIVPIIIDPIALARAQCARLRFAIHPYKSRTSTSCGGRENFRNSLPRARTMPFADNQGVRIHYETVGSGPALVLHHGTFLSGESWVELGYVEALKEDHRLILLDKRSSR